VGVKGRHYEELMCRPEPREQPVDVFRYHLGPSVHTEDHYCNEPVCVVSVSLCRRETSRLGRLFINVNRGPYIHCLESVWLGVLIGYLWA
jgi:hypothetical protein